MKSCARILSPVFNLRRLVGVGTLTLISASIACIVALVCVGIACNSAAAQENCCNNKHVQACNRLNFIDISASKLSLLLPNVNFPNIIDTRNESAPDAESTFFYPQYFVARYDLNGDGLDEFFVYRAGEGLCGSHGCELDIYYINESGKYSNIFGTSGDSDSDTVSVQGIKKICILNTTHNNYKDIILNGEECTSDYCPSLWQWNGKSYVSSAIIK